MLNIKSLTPRLSVQAFTKSIDDDKCSGQSVKALSPALFFDSATDKSEIKRQVKRQVNTYGQLAAYKNARNKLVPKPIAQPRTDW